MFLVLHRWRVIRRDELCIAPSADKLSLPSARVRGATPALS